MLIGVGKKFVFVANTKTASTSIEYALMPHTDLICSGTPQRKHLSLHRALGSYPFLFKQPGHDPATYFKFGVMRDPIEWIGSWFRYRKGNEVESELPANITFEEFWAAKDWNIQRADGSKYLQRDMFCGPDGTVLADVIIPYHRLGEVFGEICDMLDISCPLPRHNVSQLDRMEELPARLHSEMREFYAPDYDLMSQLDDMNAAGMDRLRARRGL